MTTKWLSATWWYEDKGKRKLKLTYHEFKGNKMTTKGLSRQDDMSIMESRQDYQCQEFKRTKWQQKHYQQHDHMSIKEAKS